MGVYTDMAERLVRSSCLAPDALWPLGYWYAGEPCWLWLRRTGTSGNNTYGRLCRRFTKGPRKGKQQTVLAHRMSVRTFTTRYLNSRTPVLHLCNNRECINPAHLTGGTVRMNNQQTVRDGRHWSGSRGTKAAYYGAIAADFQVLTGESECVST